MNEGAKANGLENKSAIRKLEVRTLQLLIFKILIYYGGEYNIFIYGNLASPNSNWGELTNQLEGCFWDTTSDIPRGFLS